jgi:hypothetical protein
MRQHLGAVGLSSFGVVIVAAVAVGIVVNTPTLQTLEDTTVPLAAFSGGTASSGTASSGSSTSGTDSDGAASSGIGSSGSARSGTSENNATPAGTTREGGRSDSAGTGSSSGSKGTGGNEGSNNGSGSGNNGTGTGSTPGSNNGTGGSGGGTSPGRNPGSGNGSGSSGGGGSTDTGSSNPGNNGNSGPPRIWHEPWDEDVWVDTSGWVHHDEIWAQRPIYGDVYYDGTVVTDGGDGIYEHGGGYWTDRIIGYEPYLATTAWDEWVPSGYIDTIHHEGYWE